MLVTVTVEARLHRTPDGIVWCDNQFPFPYEFWTRYLSAFEAVLVVARVQDAAMAQTAWKPVEGKSVKVHALPYYVGPWAFLKNYSRLKKRLFEVLSPHSAYILRVGSPIADLLQPELVRRGFRYGVEVVGDPWDTFSPGSVNHPLRFFFRRWFTYKLQTQCRHAFVASYVTERMLQKRYPAPQAQLTIAASSITLTDEAIAPSAKTYRDQQSYQLIVVGSLEDQRKGIDVLLRALKIISEHSDKKVRLRVIGDGRKKTELQLLAQELGISDKVEFLGALPAGEMVRAQLAASDIFVLPSRAEGLPRAMIEAMAQGLFCIGSSIAGIPELLDQRWLCPAGDEKALAECILDGITHPELMGQEAKKNLERARNYHIHILSERRQRLYQKLRQGVER